MSFSINKPIELFAHARGYLHSRGFMVAEVEDAIRTTPWQSAELGGWSAARTFSTVAIGTGSFMRRHENQLRSSR